VTRPQNLGRPVRCARCGEKFTRTHGRQKLCPACQPRWVRARSAARAATRPARLAANREARKQQDRQGDPAWQAALSSLCPHGVKLRDCEDAWCRSRRDDWAAHDYPPGAP
jgi:hypothetical protein